MARRTEAALATTPSARSSAQILRWPHAAQAWACLAANGSIWSTTGAGQGPLPGRLAPPATAVRQRYQVAWASQQRAPPAPAQASLDADHLEVLQAG